MLRTIGIVALVAAALIAMPAVEADAHWTLVNGALKYHASIHCGSVWKNVKNLSEDNPMQGVCSPVGVVVEVECESPTHKIVKGVASHPIVFAPVSGEFEQTFNEKTKGRAHMDLEFIEDHETLGLTSEDVCNNQWTLRRAILREAIQTVDVYLCGTDGCDTGDINPGNLVATAVLSCVLPNQFNFNNPPAPPLEVPCDLESFEHHQ
ncbi:MAG TPA: hypothetical protein VFY54_08780 [Rubrobacter sp.]|nr:hypothetical protein [Rubrobacter sp.]